MSADNERTAESPTKSLNGEKGRVTQLEQSEDVYVEEVDTSEVDERKLMRKVDGGAYESDDDKNPYASSVRFLPNNGGLLAVLFLGIPC